MYYVYVLYCRQVDKFYIGFTEDLKQRVHDHKYGNVITTSKMGKIELVYYEASLFKKDATEREKQLKTGFGREYLRKRVKYFLIGNKGV